MTRFNWSAMKDNLLEASPEEITEEQEDAGRAMKKLFEEEEKAGGVPAAVSQKKKQTKTVKDRSFASRLPAEGQGLIKRKEE
jgi:hypothetical protein